MTDADGKREDTECKDGHEWVQVGEPCTTGFDDYGGIEWQTTTAFKCVRCGTEDVFREGEL